MASGARRADASVSSRARGAPAPLPSAASSIGRSRLVGQRRLADAANQIEVVGGERTAIEAAHDVVAAGVPERRGQGAVVGHALQRGDQLGLVLRLDADAAAGAPHQLGGVAFDAEDDRLRHRRRFEDLRRHHGGEQVALLQMHQAGVDRRQQRRDQSRVQAAGEGDVAQAEARGLGLEVGAHGAVADDQEVDVVAAAFASRRAARRTTSSPLAMPMVPT